MFVPVSVIRFLIVTAWGTACWQLFSFGWHRHIAAADLWNVEPFSQAAFAAERTVENITLFGLFIGFIVFGILADRLGRCRILLTCLGLAPLFSGFCCVSFSPADFLFLHFATGASCGGVFLTGTLLLYEQRDAAFRREGMIVLPCLTLVFLSLLALLPVLPPLHWRASFAATILPVVLPFFFFRYYDEPSRWKIAVRDKQEPIPYRYGTNRKRRLILWGLLWALGGVLFLSHSLSFERSPYFSVYPPAEHSLQETFAESLEDRIIAFLICYPQLLDTQERGQLDGQTIRERLTAHREVPQAVFDGLLTLHQQKRTVNRSNLLDATVAAWDKNRGNIRPATTIPLNEVEAFGRAAERYWDEAQNKLEISGASVLTDNEYQTVADQWKHRRESFKRMLDMQQLLMKTRYRDAKRTAQYHFAVVNLMAGWLLAWFLLRRFPCLNVLWIFPRCFVTSYRGTYCGFAAALVSLTVLLLRLVFPDVFAS